LGRGGRLVFLSDDKPTHFQSWLQIVQTNQSENVSWAVLSRQDVLTRRWQTTEWDLLVLFAEQESLVLELNFQLLGQRLLIGGGASLSDPSLYDFFFAVTDLSIWTEFWQSFHVKRQEMGFQGVGQTPALFLDRDDVLVKNVPYNKEADRVELMPGASELVARAHADSYWVVMVSNQSGLGRGRIAWSEYQQVHQQMLRLLAQEKCWLDECLWASYIDSESSAAQGPLLPSWRKPRPGLFQQAYRKLQMSMAESVMVGDSASDLIAAFQAGVGHLYLLKTEKGDQEIQILQEYRLQHSQLSFQVVSHLDQVKLASTRSLRRK
ncbi:MAG: HAD-IIIA family hydrolase, partial [Bdellovibrio sp.]